MAALPSLLSRNWNADVRPITLRLSNCISALIMSSVRPSEKYCWSLSPLSLLSGSTAMDLSDAFAVAAASEVASPAFFASAAIASSRRGASTNLSNAK